MMSRSRLWPLLSVLLTCAGCGGTGIVANCDAPRASIFSDVVLFVMPYEYPGEKRELSSDAANLALFTQLQMVRTGLGYSKFGVTLLLPSAKPDSLCDAVEVEDKLTGRRSNPSRYRIVPTQDLIIWRGRVFEDDGSLWVQNHVRLVEGAGRQFLHRKQVPDTKEAFEFNGAMPIRSITFPARKITPEMLESWKSALAVAATIRDEPNAEKSKVIGQLKHSSPAEYKIEAGGPTESGWARIVHADGASGWIQVGGPDLDASLLPDLRFMHGLVAFLQYYHPQTGVLPDERIELVSRAFEAYRKSETSPNARSAILASLVMQGFADLSYGEKERDSDRIRKSSEEFDRVAKELPLNSQVRTLTALPRIVSCCNRATPDEQTAIERTLLMAIVADPTNQLATKNLETFYEYLVRARVSGPYDRATVNARMDQLRSFKEATVAKKEASR